VAVIACNGATDTASYARRAELARELLAAVAEGGFGRLVLSVADRAPAKLRLELLSLAGSLSHTGRGGATVSVKFKEPRQGQSVARARFDWRLA
jgi:hypothetical protein